MRCGEEEILSLLENPHNDWCTLAIELEDVAFDRPYFRGMEWHHIEPDREQLVALWPLEHLALHICHAWLNPTDRNHAAVCAFVKPFPGVAAREGLLLEERTTKKVLSFGQRRPSSQKTLASIGGKANGGENIRRYNTSDRHVESSIRGGQAAWRDSLPKMQEWITSNKDEFGVSPTRPGTQVGVWLEDEEGKRMEFPSIRTASKVLRMNRTNLTALIKGEISNYKGFQGGKIGC